MIKNKKEKAEFISNLSESEEQIILFQWAKALERSCPPLALMFHIPNGGLRGKKEAARFKKEGVKAGVPDILLPYPSKEYHGLFIELKKTGGTVSKDQEQWLKRLSEAGYKTVVCYGWVKAAEEICDYLGLNKRKLL